MSATKTEAFLITVVATAETILTMWSWDEHGDDGREALGHLVTVAMSLGTGDHAQAKASTDAIDDVLRRHRARQRAADQQAEEAALIADGWTPPAA